MTDDGADEEIVTFRLGPHDRAAIQRLVQRGEFRNRSDFLRYAVKTLLRAHDAAPAPAAAAAASRPPKLDLDLEPVELPASDAAAHGHRRSRAGGQRLRGNSR